MSPTDPPSQPGAAAADAAEDVRVLTSRGTHESCKASAIRGHDFRQSGFLPPSELRRIRLRHEQFIRSLAARLAIFLRLEVTVQLSKVQIVGYQKFTEPLANPTHITLFKTDPLKGVGLLVIPPRLSLSLVDRLLGGPGKTVEGGRELSEIETALMDQVAVLLLSEWCNHWPEMKELRPSLLGHESNSRYLQTAPPDTAMLLITMETGMGDQQEVVSLAFPYGAVEPLMRLLNPAGLPEAEAAIPAPAVALRWNSEFNDVKVPVIALWQGLKMSAGQVIRMKNGDVLLLDPECAAQVQLRLSNVPKFVGRPGTSDGKWAVQLTEALPA